MLPTDDLTQGLPFLFVFYKPPSSSHYSVNNFQNSLEPTGSSLDLDETSNGQPYLASMLKDDKKLDPKRDRFDVQSILFVDPRCDCIGFARILEIVNAVPLPFLE